MAFASVPDSLAFPTPFDPAFSPETLLRAPIGAASPLWGLFVGAAASGTAWWWMMQWIKPQNLEAMFATSAAAVALETPPPAAEAESAEFLSTAPPVELLQEIVQPAAEPVTPETKAVEAVPAPVKAPDPVISAPPAAEAPLGGEAAPLSPAAAIAPAPKPRAPREPKPS